MAPNSEEKNHRGIEKLVFTVSILAFIYSVLSNSYIDINGFLTNDSTHFLRLAQSLKDGNYIDCHSIRPFSEHREEIMKIVSVL